MWHGTSHARPRIQYSTWSLPWSSSFWLLAFPSSVMFPELERSIDFSLMTEHPTVIYYLCFDQLHVSVITSEHCKKKLLWSKLTAVWYGNKHSGLDGNFMGRFLPPPTCWSHGSMTVPWHACVCTLGIQQLRSSLQLNIFQYTGQLQTANKYPSQNVLNS